MRLLVVTVTLAERDAVLEGFPPVRLAKLLPYVETRVVESGAGTLVVLPAGEGVAAAAAAAAVAINRITPDAVVTAGLGGAFEISGDPEVLDRLARHLPEAAVTQATDDTAEGVAVAAAVHRVPSGRLVAPDLAALERAATTAFRGEWPAIPRHS